MRNGERRRPMPAETEPLVLRAGQIVLADWRGDALPKEPNKRRPAVVVEDDGLFAPSYPNAILVPLTDDAALAIPDLSVAIAPTAENGCSKACWAVSHLVATTSKARLHPTPSRIASEQLAAIRRQIALAVGIDG
jgi:mRNA interferase MazF